MAKQLSILILISAFLMAGCSNQWREGTPDRSPEEVVGFLGEITSAQSSGGSNGDITSALQFKDDSVIYFADAPSNVALVPNLVSFYDFSFLGSGGNVFDIYNTTEARVFFLDHNAGNEFGLVIGLNQGSGYQYFAFSGTGDVQDGEFVAVLNGSTSQITVRSFDTTDGELSDVIQLKIYDSEDNYLGKISTLIGYY